MAAYVGKHRLHSTRRRVDHHRVSRWAATNGGSWYSSDYGSIPFRAGLAAIVIALLGIAATGVRVVPEDPPQAVTVAAVVQADVPTPGLCEVSR